LQWDRWEWEAFVEIKCPLGRPEVLWLKRRRRRCVVLVLVGERRDQWEGVREAGRVDSQRNATRRRRYIKKKEEEKMFEI
jgi:hypothetical protein